MAAKFSFILYITNIVILRVADIHLSLWVSMYVLTVILRLGCRVSGYES